MQMQADLSQSTVIRPQCVESTALGAACLAGLGAGLWESDEEVRGMMAPDRVFEPEARADEVAPRWEQWQRAVARAGEWELAE